MDLNQSKQYLIKQYGIADSKIEAQEDRLVINEINPDECEWDKRLRAIKQDDNIQLITSELVILDVDFYLYPEDDQYYAEPHDDSFSVNGLDNILRTINDSSYPLMYRKNYRFEVDLILELKVK